MIQVWLAVEQPLTAEGACGSGTKDSGEAANEQRKQLRLSMEQKKTAEFGCGEDDTTVVGLWNRRSQI
jgi:hypothetical protein